MELNFKKGDEIAFYYSIIPEENKNKIKLKKGKVVIEGEDRASRIRALANTYIRLYKMIKQVVEYEEGRNSN